MDSSNPLPQLAPSQAANILARINELLEIVSAAGVYGRSPFVPGSGGLVWGYQGGRYRSQAIASGTVTLTASQTNYVVAARATGAVSTSTSTTNWNDTQNFERLYLVVTGTSSITSYEDHRALGQRGQNFPAVVTDNSANRDVASSDAGSYIRMTSGSAKTATFRPNSTHAMPTDGEWHFRCVGGDLTLTPGSGVALNEPAGGTLVLSDGMTVTVKRVAVDAYDVIGQTIPAP